MDAATEEMTWSPELHRIYGYPPEAEGARAMFRDRLDPADRLAPRNGDDEILDIPAFLRRQAN